jgi:hypothetical protein
MDLSSSQTTIGIMSHSIQPTTRKAVDFWPDIVAQRIHAQRIHDWSHSGFVPGGFAVLNNGWRSRQLQNGTVSVILLWKVAGQKTLPGPISIGTNIGDHASTDRRRRGGFRGVIPEISCNKQNVLQLPRPWSCDLRKQPNSSWEQYLHELS